MLVRSLSFEKGKTMKGWSSLQTAAASAADSPGERAALVFKVVGSTVAVIVLLIVVILLIALINGALNWLSDIVGTGPSILAMVLGLVAVAVGYIFDQWAIWAPGAAVAFVAWILVIKSKPAR